MAERTCILSGKSLPRDRLIRFVAGPEGHAVVDLAERLPGRGAWIELSAESLRRADDRKLLNRRIGAGFGDAEADIKQIARMLRARAIATAGMARRAGCLVGGSGKLAAEAVGFVGLLAAPDASEREFRRLSSRLSVEWTSRSLDAGELGRIFGRDSLAFVGVRRGRASKLAETLRLELMRMEVFSVSSACQAR
ncbi:MAG: DUF448 domain-containing protein [Rhodobiaceae bacterium]|jgi:predicted RNA-binding protein YlxR (DUF448 family)